MSSWYSVGAEAAEQVAASTITRRRKNFFTDQKKEEAAVIRFLSPATKSFNYKRAFVEWAKGEKMLTSPGGVPDPLEAAGRQLQAAFAWVIIDRRVIEFTDNQTNETKKVGPRVLYFADGPRTRKQLIAFEKQALANVNEDREEEGQEPLTLEDFNLTHYDLRVSKAKGAPWNFQAKRPKPLSDADKKLLADAEVGEDTESQHKFLLEELKPLPLAELQAILAGGQPAQSNGSTEEATSSYSYSDEDDDTIKLS